MIEYFEVLVRDSADEVFEDGMDSQFSLGLHSAVVEHGTTALLAIDRVILAGNTNAELLGETLVQIGAVDDPATHDRRLVILTKALKSQDVRVRDAASLGLETMEDASAIPALETAVAVEESELMRKNLIAVIGSLRGL